MKVEINIDNLSGFLTAYNHAYYLLHETKNCCLFGLYEEISGKLYNAFKEKYGEPSEKWHDAVIEELGSLSEVYKQLEKIENEQNEGD